tara:strand:+ start:151 stop:1449 length:1299 start_codon:yes stop_codon:yes gene_type:complete
MTKKLRVKPIMTDKEISSKEGEYFDESHYTIILNSDTDVYTHDGDLLLKFRKGVLDVEHGMEIAKQLKTAAKKTHENRGASAGELDRNKLANYIGDLVTPGKFRTRFKSTKTGILSKQATSNLSPSNIIGFFDRPDRNLKGKGAPCRLTAFNRDHPEIWQMVLPFIKVCDKQFKKLTPKRYKIQYKQAQLVDKFAIDGTSFSTVTINYSWRTALHRDAGDLVEGFGNLIVLKDPTNKNDYDGCYTGFPQYGIAINVQPGDFLAMNVHEWHCNTEFKPKHTNIIGKWSNREIVNNWYFNRLSMVCYLREKMIRCKNMRSDKVQLLQTKKSKNMLFNVIKNYPRPDTYMEFTKKLGYLKSSITRALKTTDPIIINLSVSNYYSYFVYYYEDFTDDNTPKNTAKFLKTLNILIGKFNNFDSANQTLIDNFKKKLL